MTFAEQQSYQKSTPGHDFKNELSVVLVIKCLHNLNVQYLDPHCEGNLKSWHTHLLNLALGVRSSLWGGCLDLDRDSGNDFSFPVPCPFLKIYKNVEKRC